MAAVLDACTLIQFIEETHARHEDTVELLASLNDDFLTTAVTLAEVLVGAVRVGRASDAIDRICTGLGVQVVDGPNTTDQSTDGRVEWALIAATSRAQATPRIGIADAIVLATAAAGGHSVITFDAGLRAACVAHQVPILPRQ